MEFHLFMPQMRLSLARLVTIAQHAEAVGFDGIALIDHLAPPFAEEQPMYEALTTATWLAAHTHELTIGELVLCDAMRHPAVLAKQAVTLDHASDGRFELGIGAGSVPSELDRYGVHSPSADVRVERLADTLAVLHRLWSGQRFSYSGRQLRITDGYQRPTPLTRIPIVIGGTGPRMLKLVAQYADWWNLPLDHLERLGSLRSKVGRAQVSVQVMVAMVLSESDRRGVKDLARRRFGSIAREGLLVGAPDEIRASFAAIAAQGVERAYVWFSDFAKPQTLDAFAEHVIGEVGTASGSTRNEPAG